MHCHICDAMLNEKEIIYSEDLHSYEPCSVCLEAAFEAAYCNGFNKEDDEFIIIEDEDQLTLPLFSSFLYTRTSYSEEM